MDTIEFRSMNSSIQTEANAAFVQPTQAYANNNRSGGRQRSGCSNGCYDNGTAAASNGIGYERENRSNGCSNGCYGSGTVTAGNGNNGGSCNNGNYDNNGSQYTRNGHIYYKGCEEIKINEMDDKEIEATGRIMDVTMTLKNVCPCRRVSVGYMVTEMDNDNNEHSCGFKCFTVPAHYNSECCDVEVERTRFILPDDARVDGCTGHCSGQRHFIVRAEAHYADSNVTMP